MLQLDDVAVLPGQDIGDAEQGTGTVGEEDGEGEDAAPHDQAVLDQGGHGDHVHVAAGEDADHVQPLAGQVAQSGHGQQAGVLHHHLMLFHHIQESLHQLRIWDGDDLVHMVPDVGEHLVSRGLDGGAVSDGVGGGQGDHMARLQAGLHAGRPLRLHADNFYVGVEQLGQGGHTRRQPAAADGHQDHVHIRQLLQNLQTDGALTGHDPIVVKGMDKGQPLLVPQAHGLGIGVVIHAVHQHHVGPIAAGGLDLGNGGGGGDADGGGDLHIPGGKAHALGMVACGAGDNAPALLLVGQGGDLIVRAPQLEGPRLLQAVRLQIKVAVRHQARRVQHRGLVDNGGQHPACVLEHFHRDHIVASLILFYIQNPIFCSYAMYYHDTLSRRDCQFLFGQRAAFFAI